MVKKIKIELGVFTAEVFVRGYVRKRSRED